jgi:hypothetical protein
MSDVQTWSTTAASNNSAAPNGFPEGMPPSGVNDAAREVMAAVARYREDTDGVNTSSGTDTITLASSRTMTAYAQGDMYTFKAGGTNTGATTLNVDGLGAKDVQFNGAACTGGEIITDLMYTVVYDGTQFQLMNAASYPAIDIETLEVTNIKAKDGTASASIADSTGIFTHSTATIVSVADDTNAALRVTQTGTGNALLIEDSSNPDSTPLVVDSVGDLITGSTVSYAGCAVHGTNPATKFQMHGYVSGDVNINAFSWDSSNVYAGGYVGLKSASDAIGTHTAVSDGDRMVGFVGAGSDGTNFVRSAFISMDVEGTVATDSVPSSMKFYTTGVGDTSNTLRLRIHNDGRINSQGGRIGYGAGGSAVTQTTSRTTGVTIDACSGKITLVSAAGSTAYTTFTVTNSQVNADTTVIVNQRSGTNKYKTHVTAVSSGSFNISFATTSGTATDSPVFNFALIQASDT